MMKRVYIETTVVSYFAAPTSRDVMIAGHQEATRRLWPELSATYDTFVSALVYDEARHGAPEQAEQRLGAMNSFKMLDIDNDARALASCIIARGGVPKEHPEDALHIAVAAVNGMDVLLTWNFTHMNNPFTRIRIRRTVEEEGYLCPEICSPEELLEVDK